MLGRQTMLAGAILPTGRYGALCAVPCAVPCSALYVEIFADDKEPSVGQPYRQSYPAASFMVLVDL